MDGNSPTDAPLQAGGTTANPKLYISYSWTNPDHEEWVLRLEFKTFVQAFVRLPCQLVRSGRRLVYRLLAWNPHQAIFFRLVDGLRC